jgi:hypothetical protein
VVCTWVFFLGVFGFCFLHVAPILVLFSCTDTRGNKEYSELIRASLRMQMND